MNRSERRREDRTNNKLIKWLKGLSTDQRNLLAEYCMEQSKSDLMGYFNAYERVIRPVLFDVIQDINETEKILQRIVDEVGEEGINLHRFENGSVEYMKKIEDSREEIIKNYIEMSNAGVAEKDIQNGLKTLYPKLTPNAIKNIVLEYKRDLKKIQILETGSTDEAVKYIFEKEPKETPNKAHIEEIKVSDVIIPEKGNAKVTSQSDMQNKEAKNMFEVLEQKITLKGKYGTYKKDNSGVLAGEIMFENETSVDNYVQTEVAKQKQAVEEEVTKLKDHIDKLYECLDKEIEEFKLKTNEIKAVFSYM